MDKQVIKAVKESCKEYAEVSEEDIKIERLTGISNVTFKVSCKSDEKVQPLVYRKFGQSTKNIFLDRESEKYVYEHISDERQGPKILHYLDGVRIEEFVPSKVLETDQMLKPDYYERVAYALRRFHDLPAPKLENKSFFKQLFFEERKKIIKICTDKLNQDIYSENQKETVQKLKKWVSDEEIDFIQKVTEPLQKEDLVFSHNDLLANNVLIKESNERVMLIDYEYARFNYPVYDIANYFTETEYDYDVKEEPYFGVIKRTEEKQKQKSRFVKCYCLAKERGFTQYSERVKKDDFDEAVQKEAEELERKIPLGMMLCNFMWGWWAIIVCKNKSIDFDYVEFAKKRYNDYQELKKSQKWKI